MIGAKHPDDLSSNPSGSIYDFYLYGTSDREKALKSFFFQQTTYIFIDGLKLQIIE
jgi:hypothetical protein